MLPQTLLVIAITVAVIGGLIIFLIVVYLKSWLKERQVKRWEYELEEMEARRQNRDPGASDKEKDSNWTILSCYDILGVERDATVEDIKKGYRRMCKKVHPDVSPSEYREWMTRLNQARDVLLDPRERRRYDKFLGERELSVLLGTEDTTNERKAVRLSGNSDADSRVLEEAGELPRLPPSRKKV